MLAKILKPDDPKGSSKVSVSDKDDGKPSAGKRTRPVFERLKEVRLGWNSNDYLHVKKACTTACLLTLARVHFTQPVRMAVMEKVSLGSQGEHARVLLVCAVLLTLLIFLLFSLVYFS